MQGFSYDAPTTLAAAVDLLAEHQHAGRRAQLLAGGTDLLVQVRALDPEPRAIVDVKNIAETRELAVGADRIFVGAAVPAAEVTANGALQAAVPGVVEAIGLIGSTQVQGRATAGGNLCNASPAGDSIPALIAAGAVCQIIGPGGRRSLPVEEFVVGVGRNALAADELLIGLEIGGLQGRQADAYLRFIPRTEMDIAVAGAGVSLALDGDGVCSAARVGIGAVAPTALLVPAAAAALVGSHGDEAALRAVGEAATAAASPITDKRGTADYRRKVVAVLARRAATIAWQRALEKAA